MLHYLGCEAMAWIDVTQTDRSLAHGVSLHRSVLSLGAASLHRANGAGFSVRVISMLTT